MTTYTTTSEKNFEGKSSHGVSAETAVMEAIQRMERAAKQAGYDHEVVETFVVSIVKGPDGVLKEAYVVKARCTYAKIVAATAPEPF